MRKLIKKVVYCLIAFVGFYVSAFFWHKVDLHAWYTFPTLVTIALAEAGLIALAIWKSID
ncbi:MAG: hypothetical protein EHM49_02335 [Deltaproteobacteria bacterium]|nr:MAG: hypothetical protein EHM49_02335 [Deltaproteobacteria bacterium]